MKDDDVGYSRRIDTPAIILLVIIAVTCLCWQWCRRWKVYRDLAAAMGDGVFVGVSNFITDMWYGVGFDCGGDLVLGAILKN